MTLPDLEFKNVGFSFDGKQALVDVSFQLAPRQMIIITGASQAGKSVLMHLAMGLLQPASGRILVQGRDIESLSETELLRLRANTMGLAFQEDTLFTGMTAFDNAAYRLAERGMPEEQIASAVDEILRFVGLEKDGDKLPEELSVGMRRRLEIARGLAGWPRIMLFDEPTSGLDPINARQVMDLVIRARDVHKLTSLYVTKEMLEIPYLAHHRAVQDPSGAMSIQKESAPKECDLKVMVLDEGGIVFFGTPSEFQESSTPAVRLLTHPEGSVLTSSPSILHLQ